MKTSSHLFILLTLITITTITSCGQASPTLEPGDSEHKLTVDGLERSYLLHIPPGMDMAHPSPLVFAFHGAGDDPTAMQSLAGFNEIADNSKFLLVYPIGIGQ